MDFALSFEQQSLVDALEEFCKRELYPHENLVEELRYVPDEIRQEIRRKSKEAGFEGMSLPEDRRWSYLFTHVLVERVEPQLGNGRVTVLDRYPACEAALARRVPGDARVSERFEVYAYWSQAAMFERAAARHPDVNHRSLVGLDDEALARSIVGDRIDILVDVAGHGAGNALPVMALRPASIQMTWLDYLATTGLETVDYRITDAVADPEGAEAAHVEQLIRLPVPQWCYRPPVDAPAIVPRTEGPITFGSDPRRCAQKL